MSNRWAAIARLGGLGDNLIAGSPLMALKRMGYMTEVIASEPNHVVYLHNPYIDKLSVKNTERDMPQNDMEGWQKWFNSRAHEYDLFIHASHSCEGRHALFDTMTAFWWSPEARRKMCGGSYLETVHDIANVPYEFGPLFFSSEEEKTKALETKRSIGPRCIAWVISGSRIDKVYPYSSLAIARIIKELGVPVVMIGSPSPKEFSMAEAIMNHVAITNSTTDGLHLALTSGGAEPGGKQSWPIRRSLSLAMQCDLVITPDTGTAWAVAMEPMPKIVMVSHASDENITKHWVNTTTLHADPDRVPCWPCHRLHNSPATCIENKEKNGAACISDISVEKLLSVTTEQWKKVNGNVVHAETAFSIPGKLQSEGSVSDNRRREPSRGV